MTQETPRAAPHPKPHRAQQLMHNYVKNTESNIKHLLNRTHVLNIHHKSVLKQTQELSIPTQRCQDQSYLHVSTQARLDLHYLAPPPFPRQSTLVIKLYSNKQ